MKKELQIRKDGKTRIILDDGSMCTPWLKNQEGALKAIGRAVLKYGDGWVAQFKWKETEK